MNPPNEILLALGDYALLSSIPALALFVGFYYFGSPWKKLLVGRSLMYFAVSLLIISLVVLASLFFGPTYTGREWVRLSGYILVSVTTWRLFFTLRKIQKERPRDEDSREGIIEDTEPKRLYRDRDRI